MPCAPSACRSRRARWLDLLAVLQSDVVPTTPEALHGPARTVLVKDERHYDRFDRAFGRYLQEVLPPRPTRWRR
jgi:uncharacterized protein with von Willebrand factor type A (vWA) domain